MISDLASADMIEFIIWNLMEGFENFAGGGGVVQIISNNSTLK